jgi:hypothetical protein
MATPYFSKDVPAEQRTAQLLADAAKLPDLVTQIQKGRHSMCIPAQPDDYDLLLTRIAALVPLVLSTPDAAAAGETEGRS